jgi:uncharacterized protein (TIGR02145 family)
MKNHIAFLMFFLLTGMGLLAQVGINTDSSLPHNSAMLDVKSTVKGFLPPRMTQAEMSTILNPAEGLMVFCTDCGLNGTGVIVVFMNGTWSTLAVNCILPVAPAAGVHIPSPVQIIWNWNTVSCATGYKWSVTNDFATATDMGTATTKTETGLTCNTTYTRYAWAYSACGNSTPVTLTQTTSLNPPAVPTAGTHVPSVTQIIWNWNTVSGATGYKWSATNDFAFANDMGTATTKTETGLTCNTAYTRYVWAYGACGNSIPITLTNATSACSGNWSCGTTIAINHVAGTVAPATKTVTYGTATNIPGELTKCWITSNLGADHQATALYDATEASAGWYWQFNRMQGFKLSDNGITRTPNSIWITYINETSDWITANDPCFLELGSGWRIPTISEWANVDASSGWTDWNGPWNSALKIHTAGFLYNNSGSLSSRGSSGHYWSSMHYDETIGYVWVFDPTTCDLFTTYKGSGFSLRCLKETCSLPNAPTSGTHVPSPTQIIWNWNTVSGATGYKWSATNDVATATDMGTATTKTETGLTCNTAYTRYAWAYNTCGNSTPVTLNQTSSACTGAPCPGTPTVTHSGQVYNTVQIGTQCWLKENLNIGTRINGSVNQTNNSIIEKYCYNDLESNCGIYGGLYQWDEMMQYVTTAGTQGICPAGWHLPTDAEWTSLTNFLGGVDVAGGKLKETGTTHWNDPNTGATNESGFTAFGGGYLLNSTFYAIKDNALLWSSSEMNTRAWNRDLQFNTTNMNINNQGKEIGFSVRCVRDN